MSGYPVKHFHKDTHWNIFKIAADLVPQCAKPLPVTAASLNRVPTWASTALLPIHLPVNALGKVVQDSPRAWVPACVETPTEFLAPGLNLALSWLFTEVNQQMEHLSLSLLLFQL